MEMQISTVNDCLIFMVAELFILPSAVLNLLNASTTTLIKICFAWIKNIHHAYYK